MADDKELHEVAQTNIGSNHANDAPASEVPDPEDDDLDDLDEILDEFAAVKLDTEANKETPNPNLPNQKGSIDPGNEEGEDDDFVRLLNAGMADLLGDLQTTPDTQAQFEKLVKEFETSMAPPEVYSKENPVSAGGSMNESTSTEATSDLFQETIRRTMERMQKSGDKATAAAASEDPDDILAEMLKQMQNGALGETDNEEDFSKILLGMMEQLTNKDILYDPMKELNDKFPNWMAQHKETVSTEDLERYQEQQTVVGEIVARFEESTYKDTNSEDRQYIVERMQKMQAAGSPPPDLVGDLSSAQEALGDLETGCPQQ